MTDEYLADAHTSGVSVQTGPSPVIGRYVPSTTRPGIPQPHTGTVPRPTVEPHPDTRPISAVPTPATWRVEPGLRSRGPSFARMKDCLDVQSTVAPRGAVAGLLGLSPLHPDARSAYRGALGEIVIANVLSQLGAGWTVLHTVPVGTGDTEIDHVLLGPAGIFTVSVLNYSGKKIWVGGGTFLVNGYKHNDMRRSFHEAAAASTLLSSVTGRPVVVTPLIVVVNPASITIGRRLPRVTVLSTSSLGRWLSKRPRVLSSRAVAHFSMFAEERSTWCTRPIEVEDTSERERSFETLRAEVDAARQKARLWLFGLMSVAIVSLPFAGLLAWDAIAAAMPVGG